MRWTEHYYICPYWFEGQGVILKQEVFSTTHIKIKSQPTCTVQNPHKTLFRGQKKLITLFCGTPCMYLIVHISDYLLMCPNK